MTKRITESQKQQLRTLVNKGLTAKQISVELGISLAQVYKHWPKVLKRWTTSEVQTLKKLWQNVNERKLRKALSGRTWRAIRTKAVELGLPSGVPQGHLSIMAASDRYGCTEYTLLKVAREAGIQINRRYRDGERSGKRPFMYVEWDEIRDALDAYYHKLSVPSIEQCSEVCGVSRSRLRRKLQLIGYDPPMAVRTAWRVPIEVAKQAASLETTGQVRKRLGITRHRLRKILTKARLCNGKRVELPPHKWNEICGVGT